LIRLDLSKHFDFHGTVLLVFDWDILQRSLSSYWTRHPHNSLMILYDGKNITKAFVIVRIISAEETDYCQFCQMKLTCYFQNTHKPKSWTKFEWGFTSALSISCFRNHSNLSCLFYSMSGRYTAHSPWKLPSGIRWLKYILHLCYAVTMTCNLNF
jgi:hypothetical protein